MAGGSQDDCYRVTLGLYRNCSARVWCVWVEDVGPEQFG